MTPPNQNPRRPGSSPELVGIRSPDQPEREAVHHPGVEDAPQPPPQRRGTLPGGMAAIPARASGEFAPTLPAPKQPSLKKTWRVPTPPSAAALARRSDPPTGTEPPPRTDAPTGQPGASLPPPSASAEESSRQAQRREIDRVTAERDQARAQVQLEKLRAEEQAAAQEQLKLDAAARLAQLQLEIERERTKQASAPAKKWLDERLIKALVALLTALAALGAPFGIWLTAKTTAAESAQARQSATTKEASTTASSAKAESSTASKELDELRKQLAAQRAYDREVWRRMGIIVPKRDGDPDPPQLDVEVPLRKPGTVTPGPVLVVKTPPP